MFLGETYRKSAVTLSRSKGARRKRGAAYAAKAAKIEAAASKVCFDAEGAIWALDSVSDVEGFLLQVEGIMLFRTQRLGLQSRLKKQKELQDVYAVYERFSRFSAPVRTQILTRWTTDLEVLDKEEDPEYKPGRAYGNEPTGTLLKLMMRYGVASSGQRSMLSKDKALLKYALMRKVAPNEFATRVVSLRREMAAEAARKKLLRVPSSNHGGQGTDNGLPSWSVARPTGRRAEPAGPPAQNPPPPVRLSGKAITTPGLYLALVTFDGHRQVAIKMHRPSHAALGAFKALPKKQQKECVFAAVEALRETAERFSKGST